MNVKKSKTPMHMAIGFQEWQNNSPSKRHLEYILGKWFIGGVEIPNISQWLMERSAEARSNIKSYSEYFELDRISDIEEWKESFITYTRDKNRDFKKWYDSSIVREAKEDGPIQQLAYPLNKKQLKIINILLFHPDEDVLFICSGIGGSGKSTFGNIVCQLFDNDVANIADDSLNNKFGKAEAIKHRLIFARDMIDGDIDFGTMKTLISKEPMQVQEKFGTPYDTKCQSAMLINCNNPPKIDLADSGVLRRIIYYYNPHKIKTPKFDMREKVYTREELVNIARVAYRINMDNWKEDFKKDTHKCLSENNSVYLFLESDYQRKEYDLYKDFCMQKGLKFFSEPKFVKLLELFKQWEAEKNGII